ncbi:S-layer homology domain-containing protein [Peptoniphilus equinus]|uniref:S-layer homology domain-containing protein n=1 Tax=Peptoniphilus equinus TaxID=3016343 RepID=A0ABY7QTP7_9FIRM|nr:S-layer homology domain-containing protein [Peptoniphilus equinus]WBW50167.1 S-layer homology domain-containing protein [Peptoniphilus equinus]
MKKFLILIAALSCVVGFTSKTFTDTSEHWAKDYIAAMAQEELLLGYSDGSFQPDRAISMSETYSIINRMFNFNSFQPQDVEGFRQYKDKWFYNDLLAAYTAGYLRDDEFADRSITRLEVARILSRLYTLEDEGGDFVESSELNTSDRLILRRLEGAKIFNGYADHTFKPHAPITRAEFSKVITLAQRTLQPRSAESAYAELKSLLENLNTIDVNGLSPETIERLNTIITRTYSNELPTESEMRGWIADLKIIFASNTASSDPLSPEAPLAPPTDVEDPSPITPAPSSAEHYLRILTKDTAGVAVPATITLNHATFVPGLYPEGKYLLEVQALNKKPYTTFIDLSSDTELDITLEDMPKAYLRLTLNSPYLHAASGLEYKDGARVTVTIDVPEGMKVDRLIVNGNTKGVLSDEYSFIITEDTTIDVEFTAQTS